MFSYFTYSEKQNYSYRIYEKYKNIKIIYYKNKKINIFYVKYIHILSIMLMYMYIIHSRMNRALVLRCTSELLANSN